MNINEIPTPETDAFFRQDALKNLDKYPAAAFARDLERRLAIARDALQAAIDCGMVPASSASDGGGNCHSKQVRVADQIREALTQTAPKL